MYSELTFNEILRTSISFVISGITLFALIMLHAKGRRVWGLVRLSLTQKKILYETRTANLVNFNCSDFYRI